MDKENVAYIHNGVLFSHKEEYSFVVYMKMNGTGDLHVKQNKTERLRKTTTTCFLSYIEYLDIFLKT
jgi:hypothetical protein